MPTSIYRRAIDYSHLPGTSGWTVLLLHATGGDGERLTSLVRPMVPDSAVLCPRGAAMTAAGERSFYARSPVEPPVPATVVPAAQDLAGFLGTACTRHALDPGRVAVVGHSSGANVGLGLMWRTPHPARAYALLRPTLAGLPDPVADLRETEVLLLLGDRDDVTTPARSRALEAWLTRSGASVETHREVDAAHPLTASDVLHLAGWLRRVTSSAP